MPKAPQFSSDARIQGAASPDNTGMAIYLRLMRYVKPYWGVFAIASIGMILDALTQAGFAYLLQPMIDGTFIDKDPTIIRWMPLVLVVLFVVRGAASFFGNYGMALVGRRVVRDLREVLFGHYLKLPVRFYDRSNSGQHISRLTYNTEQVALASTTALTVVIRDTLTIIALVSYLIWLSGVLTVTIAVVAPVIAVVVWFVSKRFRKIGRRIQDSMGDVTHVAEEVVDGHKVVRTFGGEPYEEQRFRSVNEGNRKLHMKLAATDAFSAPFVQFAAACALAAIVYMATLPSVLDQITPGTFVSFITAMLLILPALKRLTTVNNILQRGIAAAESVFAVIDADPEIDTGTRSMDRARGEVAYEGVSLRYEENGEIVLDDVSFEARPGTVTALVGRSGSGKTSLVSLLPRFYDPYQGVIRIDGIDIRELMLRNLRKQIALVSQDIVLFNDSVGRNIAYGGLGEASEEEIREAARAAHALDFIEKLPAGFDTPVGEKGVLLSGGQRQRIAIARAILKNAPILILDEATSSLDTESERAIQQALDSLMRERTTLVIAHRLSTVENADQVIVLRNGKVVEQGTHQQLMALDGDYASLRKLQFSE